jgi:hypothetical protein
MSGVPLALVLDEPAQECFVRKVPAEIDLGGHKHAIADGMHFAVSERLSGPV